MKKLLSIILMASMIVTLTPIACGGALTQGTAYADTVATVEVDNLKYSLSTGESGNIATVVGLSDNAKNLSNLDLIIKETIDYNNASYTVTVIGENAFKQCSNIKTVSIPASVVEIKNNAFDSCSGMTSITFAANSKLTTLGDEAFLWCTNLTTVELPDSITSIGHYAFLYSGFTSITIPGKVGTIIGGMFAGCSSLENLVLSEGIVKVENSAFESSTKLKKLTLPGTIETLEQGSGNVGDKYAFPEINFTVVYPGSKAELDSLYKYFSQYSTDIRVLSDTFKENGITYSYLATADDETELLKGIAVVTGSDENISGDIVIPSKITVDGNEYTVVRIGASAFAKNYDSEYCKNITSVTIPETVTCISSYAFRYCTGITQVTIPSSLKYISSYTPFTRCNDLKTIVYNGSDTEIANKLVGKSKASNVATKQQEAAPTNLTATAPDNWRQNNGKISGVDTSMEYQREGDNAWTTCTGTEITGLTAGTYKVREKEKEGYVAGLEATVVVPKKVVSYGGGGSSRQHPTVAETTNGTITLSSNGRTATITPDGGYEIASVTVNSENKGAVSTLTGLRTGDKIAATFQKTKATLDAETKAAVASLSTLKARSSKTAQGNIKVVAKLSTAEKAKLTALADLGYTVKYKFYRSTKKSAGYKAMFEKTSRTYSNTSGKTGTRYYYKCRVMVYDANGTLVAKTALKDCKYAWRKF